jgi:PmbA protein
VSEPDLLALARSVAGSARDGEDIEAYVVSTEDTDVRVFGGEVESLSVAVIDGVGVRVVRDGRLGFAWAGSLDPAIVSETVDEARDNAEFAAPDEWAGLPTTIDLADLEPAVIDGIWQESLLAESTDRKVALALELERATSAADPLVRGVEMAAYGDSAAQVAIASSLGVEALTRRTLCSASTYALAGEGAATQTGAGLVGGRTLDELDVEQAATDAALRAVRLLGAQQPPSRRLPVILDPLVARSLLGIIGAALNGEAIVKGRSMFADREGEDVAAPIITLVEDPTLAAAFGAVGTDAEGVPTRRVELLAGGRLQGFLHNVATARRAGAATTGSAVRGGYKSTPGAGARALHLEPGTRPLAEIIASHPDALYVQGVSGLHSGTNPVSGDFSVGAVGLLVRDGALAEPVREITIASTLQRILIDVAEVGSDLTWLPGGAAGVTLVIGEMTMSGG